MRLLTFLGTSNYTEVPYRLYGQECRTRLCPIAIATIAGVLGIVATAPDQAAMRLRQAPDDLDGHAMTAAGLGDSWPAKVAT